MKGGWRRLQSKMGSQAADCPAGDSFIAGFFGLVKRSTSARPVLVATAAE